MAVPVLIQETNDITVGNPGLAELYIVFPNAVALGNLVLAYVQNYGAPTDPAPTAPAGWTEVFGLAPYENDKCPGRLFAKINNGDADINAALVGPFANCSAAGIRAAEFSGVASATPTYSDIDVSVVHLPPGTTDSHTVTASSAYALNVMVEQMQFGESTSSMQPAGSSIGITSDNETQSRMVYRIAGPGSVQLDIEAVVPSVGGWYQHGAASFESGEPPGPGVILD
jgi:hypothetical protein